MSDQDFFEYVIDRSMQRQKAAATEVAVDVTDTAMRACGGAAIAGAHGLDRLFRDARAQIVMAPTSDQAYDFIGRALCGMEVF